MRHAHETRTPVVPQGARSALTGASVAIEGGIVLNVEASTRSARSALEGIAVAGPGVINADLKAAAAQSGLFYPPDPASSAFCTIGGNVATNAGGLCCVKYGVTADYIRGLQVVLPGGEVIRTGRRTAKGVAGLDLTGLFVGSEGTLGVVTEITARLLPAPDPALTVLGTFDSLDAASEAISALRRERHRPSLVELMDAASIAAVQALADYGFPGACAAALIVQSDRPATRPRTSRSTRRSSRRPARPMSRSPTTCRRPTCCWPAGERSARRSRPRARASSRTSACRSAG